MRTNATPWHDEPPGPQETIMRLASIRSYIEPGAMGGSHSGAMHGLNLVAQGLGAAEDKLGAAVMMAKANPIAPRQEVICNAVTVRMQTELVGSFKYGALVRGYKRQRARLVTVDALYELMSGHWQSQTRAAKRARMRKQDYVRLHAFIYGRMDDMATVAASDACSFLFGRNREQ